MNRFLKPIVAAALCVATALTGCYTSQEEQDAYLRDAHREAEEILGLGPFHPSHTETGADSVEYIRDGIRHTVYPELNIANRWQVPHYRNLEPHGLEFHGNACKQWSKFWQPVQNTAGLRIWMDRYQDEVAKPKHKQNLKQVMRDLDGAPVVLHGCVWRPQYRRPK